MIIPAMSRRSRSHPLSLCGKLQTKLQTYGLQRVITGFHGALAGTPFSYLEPHL